jgi:hypothetical protein
MPWKAAWREASLHRLVKARKAKPEKTAPGCSRDSRGYGRHIGAVAGKVKQQLLHCKKHPRPGRD